MSFHPRVNIIIHYRFSRSQLLRKQPAWRVTIHSNYQRYNQLGQMLSRVLVYQASKIKTKQVLSSSYQELVDLVAKRYSNPEFKHPNTAALYEIQHHHKVISQGDWILDIGAGPKFRWTDLALTLAQNQEQTFKVISNDKIIRPHFRPNHLFIGGNFLEEQIRTQIALTLGEKQFDVILSDASPQFTENRHDDGASFVKIAHEALCFSNFFLKKGGNIVFKIIHSDAADFLQERVKTFFHQAISYKPSVIRQSSPVYFLILKGFGMNPNIQVMEEFLKRYRGSIKTKREVMKNYQFKYDWDPVRLINDKAKNDVLSLKMQGRTDKQIHNLFKEDPYIKIGQIMKQVQKLDKAKNEGNDLAIKKTLHQFTDGKLYKQESEVPQTREEWINFLEGIQTNLKMQKNKKSKNNQKIKQNLQPLGDNEIYMKDSHNQQQQQVDFLYIEEDLTAEYSVEYQNKYIQRQLSKLSKAMGNQKGDEFKGLKKDDQLSFDKIFGWKNENNKIDEIQDLAETFRVMTDEQFYSNEMKQGYEQQLQENVGRSSRGQQNKFKNK